MLALILLVEPLALAAPPPGATPIRIDFEAPADCARKEAFYEAVHSRMDRVRLAAEGEASLVIRVRLTRAGTKINGELRIAGDQGETTRRVDGERCDQVIDALALTTVIALDRVVNSAEAPSTEPPPTPPTPAPAPPTPDRAAHAAARAPVATRPTFHVHVGARALAAVVVSPYVSVGGEVFARLAQGASGFTVDLGLLHARNDLLSPSSGVVIHWTAIALSACAPGWSPGEFRVQPCALASGGWLDATDESLDHPASVLRSWWSLGGQVRAVASLGRGFSVELEGGINVPLVRRQFVANSPDRFLGETPILSAFGTFGVAYRF